MHGSGARSVTRSRSPSLAMSPSFAEKQRAQHAGSSGRRCHVQPFHHGPLQRDHIASVVRPARSSKPCAVTDAARSTCHPGHDLTNKSRCGYLFPLLRRLAASAVHPFEAKPTCQRCANGEKKGTIQQTCTKRLAERTTILINASRESYPLAAKGAVAGVQDVFIRCLPCLLRLRPTFASHQ